MEVVNEEDEEEEKKDDTMMEAEKKVETFIQKMDDARINRTLNKAQVQQQVYEMQDDVGEMLLLKH
eukprot:CAMPEP_0114579844 /NCGR_PEP_ID=MMETSP0125-20121206/4194_1 /TAXON_ID=485358 ORGANISM="Aristerostoma sp., Strain ATCC 50986" /NCGR_SAMPLE_ID=MMETSP0125 /ASSEMBLY_ACC=CAM_ASM_000245 /LENGTH=65 /DNA_ID=CAMNT_0001770941 /DNA_START=1251 /DNA_END=1448 /DNA_ORIENTATION=-